MMYALSMPLSASANRKCYLLSTVLSLGFSGRLIHKGQTSIYSSSLAASRSNLIGLIDRMNQCNSVADYLSLGSLVCCIHSATHLKRGSWYIYQSTHKYIISLWPMTPSHEQSALQWSRCTVGLLSQDTMIMLLSPVDTPLWAETMSPSCVVWCDYSIHFLQCYQPR